MSSAPGREPLGREAANKLDAEAGGTPRPGLCGFGDGGPAAAAAAPGRSGGGDDGDGGGDGVRPAAAAAAAAVVQWWLHPLLSPSLVCHEAHLRQRPRDPQGWCRKSAGAPERV
eukprot:1157222-Pelagomonas_calceolata.AAC.10